MRKTYEELWYDIKDELMDISRWTPTVSISKSIIRKPNRKQSRARLISIYRPQEEMRR